MALVDGGSRQAEIKRLTRELHLHRQVFGRGTSGGLALFHRLVAAYHADGQQIDQLRRYEPDETRRFFATLIEGADGHVYWNGSRKGFKTNAGSLRKPVLWWWEHLYGAHVEVVAMTCGERNCVNPRHGERTQRGVARIYPEHAIIGALQVWALRHGHAPTIREWDGQPSHTIVKLRFGGWDKALVAAGLDYPRANRPRTRQECLYALRYLKRVLGHWPSYDEYREPHTRSLLHAQDYPTSPTTVLNHLTSWPNALKQAQRLQR